MHVGGKADDRVFVGRNKRSAPGCGLVRPVPCVCGGGGGGRTWAGELQAGAAGVGLPAEVHDGYDEEGFFAQLVDDAVGEAVGYCAATVSALATGQNRRMVRIRRTVGVKADPRV
jgi:hypothetical protein